MQAGDLYYSPFAAKQQDTSDEGISAREKEMQRKLRLKKLQAFDANEAELTRQLQHANNVGNEGIRLNGERMYDRNGAVFLNNDEIAAKQLAANPMAQLQLLQQGQAQLAGRPQIGFYGAQPRQLTREQEEQQKENTSETDAIVRGKRKLLLDQLREIGYAQ